MVARDDLMKIQQLDSEARMLQMAVESFNEGGVIVALRVSRGPLPSEPGNGPSIPLMMSGIVVPTVGMDYPPQMVDQIKQGLEQRRRQIYDELDQMGVTGMEEAQQAQQPQPQAQQQPPQPPQQPMQPPHRRPR